MVNPKLVRKVKKGKTFTPQDVMNLIASIKKQEQGETSFLNMLEDSNNYFKNNFSDILFMISDFDFQQIITMISLDKDAERIFLSMLHDNIEAFAKRINSCSYENVSMLNEIFENRIAGHEQLFSGKLEQFYMTLDSKFFNFFDVINSPSYWDAENSTEVARNNPNLTKEKTELFKKLIVERKAKPIDVFWIAHYLISIGETDFIKENITSIAEITATPIGTMNLLRTTKFDVTEYARVINERRYDIVCEMVSKIADVNAPGSKDSIETITMMIDEVVKSQGLEFSDLEFFKQGGYSNVFRAGSKIIKLGNRQERYNIPRNSKRFIQPIVRYNFGVIKDRRPEELGLEITELCETSNEFSIDEMYSVYRDIREQGMIWTDCKPSNLGRLLKENVVHHPSFKGVKKAHHSRIGIDEDNDVDVLPAGELVVLDLDYIFDENDPNIIYPTSPNYQRILEERYKREKAEEARKAQERPAITDKKKTRNGEIEI